MEDSFFLEDAPEPPSTIKDDPREKERWWEQLDDLLDRDQGLTAREMDFLEGLDSNRIAYPGWRPIDRQSAALDAIYTRLLHS